MAKRRRRWVCRIFGHRYYDPVSGNGPIAFYVPSAEGSFGWPPLDKVIGVCGCGEVWRDENG